MGVATELPTSRFALWPFFSFAPPPIKRSPSTPLEPDCRGTLRNRLLKSPHTQENQAFLPMTSEVVSPRCVEVPVVNRSTSH